MEIASVVIGMSNKASTQMFLPITLPWPC